MTDAMYETDDTCEFCGEPLDDDGRCPHGRGDYEPLDGEVA